MPCIANCWSTPHATPAERAREDIQGRLFSGVAGLHPDHRRFGQVTPGPSTTLRKVKSRGFIALDGPLDNKEASMLLALGDRWSAAEPTGIAR